MEEERFEVHFSQYEKWPYKNVFGIPPSDWKVEASWSDAYYTASRVLIERVAKGAGLPAIEGVVGLYLFRHYLELGLKYIIFHSRWLKDARTNARFDEIEDVKKGKKGHNLAWLWDTAVAECQARMSKDEWSALDIGFVHNCIKEFHFVDPDGERFRYHGEKFGVEKEPAKREVIARTLRQNLWIDFDVLLNVMDHVHHVLEYLDVYMVETYGMNEEWESYLQSL